VLYVKVLITGAGGQVGQALVSSAPTHYQLIPCVHADLDVADERAVQACIRSRSPAVIVNAAAYTAVDRAEAEPDQAQRINSDAAFYLARAARAVGARLVHISTDFVFDGRSSVPYRPEATTRPLNRYGLSKRAGERRVLRALPDQSVVLRTSWVYAPRGRNFVATMLRLMREGRAVRVVTDQVGTPTAARSVAEAIWHIIGRPGLRGVHHWTDAGVASWYDFAVAIAEEAPRLGLLPAAGAVEPIPTSAYPTPARRPPFSVLDKSSLLAHGLIAMHWRTRLRTVLQEFRNA
jgi:dTDP-4-dehydrorhamnose reductase